MCETRLNADGPAYELALTENGMLAREHQRLGAWRALGWRDTLAATGQALMPTIESDPGVLAGRWERLYRRPDRAGDGAVIARGVSVTV
jgi:hypothetical protein